MAKSTTAKEQIDYKKATPTTYKQKVMEYVKDRALKESFINECLVPKKKGNGKEIDKKKAAEWINKNVKEVEVIHLPDSSKKGGKSIEAELLEWLEQ